MIIRTETGSLYEIDAAGERIRRLHGKAPATARTARTAPDGEWRSGTASNPTIGRPLLIVWADEKVGPPAAPGAIPGTMTSRVVEIYR